MNIGPWDIALVLVVSIQATVLAFIHNPRWKAFLLNIPIPFTLANLSLGTPIGTSQVLGGWLLLLFVHSVRWLHAVRRVPIVPTIAFSGLGYCLIGGILARVVPDTDAVFWIGLAVTYACAFAMYRWLPHREEPGHRSPLPVPVKFAAIAGVITFLVLIKTWLRGFLTLFPMVTTVAAYEQRHSLWTMTRQIPVVMLLLVPMLAAMRLSQPRLGIAGGLGVGWIVFLIALWPFLRKMWAELAEVEKEDEGGCGSG